MADQDRKTLFTLLATNPSTAALKTGKVRSPLVDFNFADVKVSNTEFKPLVREHRYDLAELAIVTYLQAYEKGISYVLLPATVVGRNQHHTIFYNADRGAARGPDRQAGRRARLHADDGRLGARVPRRGLRRRHRARAAG